MHEALLAGVHAADADLADLAGLHRGLLSGDLDESPWAVAEQDRDRHAVDVAARREHIRVGVRVRVEPEHAQLAAVLARMPRGRGDRADRERMIAADENRQARVGKLRAAGVVDSAIPGEDLRQVAVAVNRRQSRIAGTLQVAAVGDFDALRFEHGLQLRDAKRLRAHRCAARAGADVRGSADDRDFLHAMQSMQCDEIGRSEGTCAGPGIPVRIRVR